MIAQFEIVADGSKWEVDIENLTWKLVTTDTENSLSGNLSWQMPNVYNMDGRTPDSPAPGAGLSSFLLVALPVRRTLKIMLYVSVEAKNLTMPYPINQIEYEIIPFKK